MEDLLSSPDPLNDSPTFQSPPKTRRPSRVRESIPVLSGSPTKQTFELDVGNHISPQKIRVTVEAGDLDTEIGYTHTVESARGTSTSPSRPRVSCQRGRTLTTTIPVKGLSDSEDEVQAALTSKRGRGRPRKSAGTPVPAKKAGRAGTRTESNGRRRKSIGDLVDGDDEEDCNFQIGTGVQLGRGKGRSRKGNSRKSNLAAKSANESVISRTSSENGRGRRRSLLPDVVLVQDEESNVIAGNENTEPDFYGALEPIDDYASNPPSACSTIRSCTTIGATELDMVIARFDTGNETPRRTGWSSPRVVEPTRVPSPRFNGCPSPSSSPGQNRSQYEENTGGNSMSTKQSKLRSFHEDHKADQHGNGAGGGDGVGEMPEFDTILESEGFSMISVDSVPSLREHLSSPVNQEPSAFRNKTLDSVKGSKVAPGEDSFSSIPDEVFQAATPARGPQNANLLFVQNSHIDDSFSSVPPEVLDAATPARRPHFSTAQSRKESKADDSISTISPVVLEAVTTAKDLPKSKFLRPSDSHLYEDSFSAIPSAVLEAATPAAARQVSLLRPIKGQKNIASDRLNVPQLGRLNSSERKSTNSTTIRLPTPEETPSPSVDAPAPESTLEKTQSREYEPALVERLSSDESSIHSQMRSSPPAVVPRRYTYTAHLRHRRELFPDLTQTPSIVFSSPSLPPPICVARGQPALQVHTEQVERPGLSPIARAGRALQDAVGPNSSPRERAQSLGSPFKSPVAERKLSSSCTQSILSPSQQRLANPLLRSNLVGNLFPNPRDHGKHQDDPFSNNVSSNQNVYTQEFKLVYTLGLPEQTRHSDNRLPIVCSDGNSLLSDDAMSWQAEEEIITNNATASSDDKVISSAGHDDYSGGPHREDSERDTTYFEDERAAERENVRKHVESAGTSQAIVIDSEDETRDGAGIEEEDENFGLLLETLNSSPAVQHAHVLAKENLEKPRRSKLPSPWRKNSKRLVYSDELSHFSSPAFHANTSLGKGLTDKSGREEDDTVDVPSFTIPQKENFKPRVRESGNLDLSALLASSPTKTRPPVLTRTSQANASTPQDSSASEFQSDQISASHSQPLKPILQKLDFKPQVRDAGDADGSSIFGSLPWKVNKYVNNIFGVNSNKATVVHHATPELSSSSAATEPLGLSSPSRSNVLRLASQTAAQVSESEYGNDSSLSLTSEMEKENQSIQKRTLKWAETAHIASAKVRLNVSPTKSCLRSPVKTPSNGSAGGSYGTNTTPSKNVAFVSSSPVPSSLIDEPLSSTTWSRDHWVLLDEIYHDWKPENNGGSEDGPQGRRRNSTRVISNLLGRKVFTQSEEMRLKQWHLEVVDEFRGIAPGWEEKVIAMRLFALIVGEEQRKRAAIGSGWNAEEHEDSVGG